MKPCIIISDETDDDDDQFSRLISKNETEMELETKSMKRQDLTANIKAKSEEDMECMAELDLAASNKAKPQLNTEWMEELDLELDKKTEELDSEIYNEDFVEPFTLSRVTSPK